MATIAINYSELRSAAGQAQKVSKRLDAYADSIENTVLRKLDNYSGDRTGNISSAVSNARNKRNQLQDDCRRYNNYSNDLKNLESDCQNTDRRVADRVKGLTGTFKNMYGIKTNAILDHIGRFMTSLSNASPFSRWIGNNIIDRRNQAKDYLKDRIKEWYNYDGGKQLIKGAGVAILEMVGSIAAIGAALLGTVTGVGALIVAVAAVVGGVIGFLNGYANFENERAAYNARQNGNASWGYRLSKLDTYTDSVRTFSDDKGIHMFADIVDGIEFVCDVIDFLDGAWKLTKKGYKWAKNSLNSLDEIKCKDIFSRGVLSNFTTKLKETVSGGWKAFTTAIKKKPVDWDFFKNAKNSFVSDFLTNMELRFADFTSAKNGMKSIKNITSLGKDLLSIDDYNYKNLSDVLTKNIILPCVNLVGMDVVQKDENGFFVRDQLGQIMFDKSEYISLGDIFSKNLIGNLGDFLNHLSIGNFSKLFNIPSKIFDLWEDGSSVIKQFGELSKINISIPKIYVPQINIPVNFNIQPINITVGLAA